MADKPLPKTTRSLPFALLRAREHVMSPVRKMLSDSDITEQQWRVLRVLYELGPMDGSSLAERASLLFPSLTRIAQSMRQKGLITQNVDPNDRRRQVIEITDEGRKVIDENLPKAQKIAENYRTKLGDENFELLLDLLAQLDE